MIDYIKAHCNDRDALEGKLIENKAFTHVFSRNELGSDSNDTIYPLVAPLENMQVRVTKCHSFISNSVHKYFNSINEFGLQNHSDFYYNEMVDSINHITQRIGFTPADFRLTILEFGLNISLDTCPSEIIDENIIFHSLKPPYMDSSYKEDERLKKFKHTNYEVKIYNKGLQFGLQENILRVEVKYTSCREFNKLGIYNLDDLFDKEKLVALYQDFAQRINEMLIIDNWRINKIGIPQAKLALLSEYTNPQYWIDLKNRKSSSTVYRKKQDLERIINFYKLYRTKHWLIDELDSKFRLLIDGKAEPLVIYNVI